MINDQRFKELANLYLDHRLTPAEARELEEMCLAEPSRRGELRAYVALQKGCSELFRRSSASAPAPERLLVALRAAEDRIARPRASYRHLLNWGWGGIGSAAALTAVVAMVAVRVSGPGYADNRDKAVPPSVIAENASETSAPPLATLRPALPPHLTLAALGIAAEDADPSARLASMGAYGNDRANASWLRAEARPEWTVYSPASVQFEDIPLSLVSPAGATANWNTSEHGGGFEGFRATTAAFTLER